VAEGGCRIARAARGVPDSRRSLARSQAPSLPHSVSPALTHSRAPSLPRPLAPSLARSLVPPLARYLAPPSLPSAPHPPFIFSDGQESGNPHRFELWRPPASRRKGWLRRRYIQKPFTLLLSMNRKAIRIVQFQVAWSGCWANIYCLFCCKPVQGLRRVCSYWTCCSYCEASCQRQQQARIS
jgi:hypothetical protein